MYLKFNLYTDEEFEKETILIKSKDELTDNTTSYILNPQLPCKQCKSMINCPRQTGRIPLYCKIVHPLFVNTLCKEKSHICPVLPTTFSLHKVKSEEITFNKSKYSKKFKNKSKNISEYSFTFGKEALSIEQMYKEIRSTDFSKNPDLKNHLLYASIKNIPISTTNIKIGYLIKSKILGIRSKNDSVEDTNRNYIKHMLSGKMHLVISN
ncbi:hypothetical protein H8356DRAFT_1341827 [Neocallimastix lanati (nom. inval.)]|nr:hypothetical protein H8356DRAFT_1341827 [Neocallimastix sp. JGI-2020a]